MNVLSGPLLKGKERALNRRVAPKRKGAGPKPKGFCSSIGNAIVGNLMGEPGHLGIINVAAKII